MIAAFALLYSLATAMILAKVCIDLITEYRATGDTTRMGVAWALLIICSLGFLSCLVCIIPWL